MTDQPSQAALLEAVRRLSLASAKGYWDPGHGVTILVARLIEKHEPETLLDPVIEARKVKAQEIAIGAHDDPGSPSDWAKASALAALSFAGWRPET